MSRRTRMCRAGVTGVAATAVDFTILMLLVERGAMVGVATFLASCGGAILAFFLAKLWTFEDRSRICHRQVLGFTAVALGSACLAAPTVQLLSMIGLDYRVARAMAAVAVFLLWSYPAQSRLAFGRRPQPL